MTVCSNCGTTQGPFSRKTIPGKAICDTPRGTKSEDRAKEYIKTVKACNQRRAKVDKGNDPNG